MRRCFRSYYLAEFAGSLALDIKFLLFCNVYVGLLYLENIVHIKIIANLKCLSRIDDFGMAEDMTSMVKPYANILYQVSLLRLRLRSTSMCILYWALILRPVCTEGSFETPSRSSSPLPVASSTHGQESDCPFLRLEEDMPRGHHCIDEPTQARIYKRSQTEIECTTNLGIVDDYIAVYLGCLFRRCNGLRQRNPQLRA